MSFHQYCTRTPWPSTKQHEEDNHLWVLLSLWFRWFSLTNNPCRIVLQTESVHTAQTNHSSRDPWDGGIILHRFHTQLQNRLHGTNFTWQCSTIPLVSIVMHDTPILGTLLKFKRRGVSETIAFWLIRILKRSEVKFTNHCQISLSLLCDNSGVRSYGEMSIKLRPVHTWCLRLHHHQSLTLCQ